MAKEDAVVSIKTTVTERSQQGPQARKSYWQRPSAENTGTSHNSTSQGRLFCPLYSSPWNYRNEIALVTRIIQMTLQYLRVTGSVIGPALHSPTGRRSTGCITGLLVGYAVFGSVTLLSDCILWVSGAPCSGFTIVVDKNTHKSKQIPYFAGSILLVNGAQQYFKGSLKVKTKYRKHWVWNVLSNYFTVHLAQTIVWVFLSFFPFLFSLKFMELTLKVQNCCCLQFKYIVHSNKASCRPIKIPFSKKRTPCWDHSAKIYFEKNLLLSLVISAGLDV